MARRSRTRDLAGLAALGALGYMAMRGDKQAPAPVEDRFTMPMPEADAAQGVTIRRPQEDSMGFNDDREPGGGGAYDLQAIRAGQTAASRPAAIVPARFAEDEAFVNRARPVAAPAVSMPLRQQLTQTTLGTPTGPASGAPSIYAGPEAFRKYREQQAAERAAQPSTPQGSARNIVQQMREKDKTVLAAVRRRQAEEEAAAQALREAEAERRREARRVELPAVGLDNPYYGRSGAQRTAALRAKGGAIKTKKMASGGMTTKMSSASKRADGIASKGKTRGKMY